MRSEKLLTAGVVAIILLTFTGLISSSYFLSKTIRPFSGKKVYHMHAADSNAYVFVDSLKTTAPDSVIAVQHNPPDTVTLRSVQFTLNHNPSLAVWIMTIAIMVGTACGLIVPLFYRIIVLTNSLNPSWKVWISAFFVTIAIGLFMWLSGRENQNLMSAFSIIETFHVLLYSVGGLKTLINGTMGVGLIAVFGIIFINFCIPLLHKMYGRDIDKILDSFRLLNDSLRFFLLAIAVLILYSLITTALMQRSINTVMVIRGFALFPTEFIYSYGLMFTVFLAAIYLPVHYHLKMEGKRIAAWMVASHDQNGIEEKIEQLEMKEPWLKTLQIFLTILSPIIGSLITDLLKHIN